MESAVQLTTTTLYSKNAQSKQTKIIKADISFNKNFHHFIHQVNEKKKKIVKYFAFAMREMIEFSFALTWNGNTQNLSLFQIESLFMRSFS